MSHVADRVRRLVLLVIAACALGSVWEAGAAGAQAPAGPSGPMAPGFADLAGRLLDTVVTVSTTKARPEARSARPDLPRFPPGSPFEEFFRQFRERQPSGRRPVSALGSGFIIDADGYVVTNHHVVAEGDSITVTLHDGTEMKAEIVGSDEPTDLVLLKVSAGRKLPAARWGNSDAVRVGDWVMAIGNPFGLGGSVSTGILSARARNIEQGPYDEYLQTDAAINRGNSGGPLFNTAGDVIGINTAIYSPTGGSVGIGFAIPSSQARPVVDQLRRYGQARRGWIGVQIQKMTPDIAESLGLKEPRGALVAGVAANGPAAAAGLRQGDVILQFGGKPILRMQELPRVVADTEIGRAVDIVVLRGGKEKKLTVTVDRLDPARAAQTAPPENRTSPAEPASPASTRVAGLALSELTTALRKSHELPPGVRGVVVTAVTEGSAAAGQGILAGDVIVEIAQEPVTAPKEVMALFDKARKEGRKTLLLLFNRKGALRYVALPVEARGG